MKKFLKIILLTLVCTFFSYNFSIAANGKTPQICTKTPESIKKFVDNINTFLDDIQPRQKNDDINKKDGEDNSNSDNGGNVFTKSISRSGAYVATNIIMSVYTLLADTVYNTASTFSFMIQELLSNTNAIFRDYRIQNSLKSRINDKLTDIGVSSKSFKTIPDSIKESFNAKFSNNGMLINTKITGDITYNELGTLIYEMYSKHKSHYILLTSGRELFSQNDSKDVPIQYKNDKEPSWYDDVKFVSNVTKYKELKNKYTKSKNCPGGFGEFIKKLKSLGESISTDGGNAIKRIKDDTHRLKNALDDFSREKNLFNTNVSLDLPFTGLKSSLSVEAAQEYTKETIRRGRREISEKIPSKKKQKKKEEKKINQGFYYSVSSTNVKENFESNVETTVNGIFSMQTTNIRNTTKIKATKKITKKLPKLSRTVYQSINLVGSRNEDGTIIDNLGKACEAQCSNLGGICWYY